MQTLLAEPLTPESALRDLVRVWIEEKFCTMMGAKFVENKNERLRNLLGIIYWRGEGIAIDRVSIITIDDESKILWSKKPFIIEGNSSIGVFVFDWKRPLTYITVLKCLSHVRAGLFNKVFIIANAFSSVVEDRYEEHKDILLVSRGVVVSDLRRMGVIG